MNRRWINSSLRLRRSFEAAAKRLKNLSGSISRCSNPPVSAKIFWIWAAGAANGLSFCESKESKGADSPFKDESDAARTLDSWFYSPRDFAVTGRKIGEA